MTRRRSDEVPLEHTAESIAKFVATHLGSPAPTSSGQREFLRRLARLRTARRNVKWLTFGAAMAAVLVMIGFAAFAREAPAPLALSYRVDNREPSSDGYIVVPRAAESVVAFSDGSKVRLEAQTRGRVLELNDRGATFALEDGRVLVDIVPRSRGHWVFKAGPFRVNVHGTSFAVTWDPRHELFEVSLTRGAISVASPIGGPEIRVHEGQSLRVNLKEQTSTLEPMSRKRVAATLEPTVPGLDAAAPRSSEPVHAPLPELGRAPAWSHRGWKEAVAGNRVADVIADADRSGLTAVLEQADADDLWALANAARYAGRYQLAIRALLAQRKRFPSSERAREAAFLLGRLYASDPDGPGKAIGWYDRYLAEVPGGANASDALGRKMTLLQRSQRRAEALDVARDYLRRFPRGTYANAARALVRSATAMQ
jgi:TolA-binding protein